MSRKLFVHPAVTIRLFTRSMGSESRFFPAERTSMLRNKLFTDRTAVVTGGGSGLGKSIAKMLAILGANVFIVSRREEVLKSACEEIRDQIGTKNMDYAVADVRDTDAVRRALDACRAKFGVPDLIVNNAAANFISPTERLSSNAFGTIVDIVLKGTANVTLQTGKDLIAAGKPGTFLAITAVYTQTGSAYVVPSAAAKAGVEAMVKSLAVEWSRYGLRFNAIAPGPIYTKGAFSRLDPTGEFIKQLPSRIPAQRLGTPEELANLAAYLLSDYSSWLNGQVINFDGGETVALAGEFNALLRDLSDKDWDTIEQMIRKNKQS
ncbi:2,4-dienoyl-CoA reductase, mitochondrial [Clonorchis sinensis]|uniref:2,4-dienoyl-CoA reductase, mitochondrial n=1 Tax=Clonorchis sinensis TaxID=79923 RepID=A0A419Q778_CLOSI|nr:2,4-dienoyl-CoA reductase, mitochondrial [Clonorchis sinensis]